MIKTAKELGEDTIISPENHKQLTELLKTIKYGSITLVIQDGKVIQIDKNEKLRLR